MDFDQPDIVLVDFSEPLRMYTGRNPENFSEIVKYAPRVKDVIRLVGVRNMIEAIYSGPAVPDAEDAVQSRLIEVWETIERDHPAGITLFDDRDTGGEYLEMFDIFLNELINVCSDELANQRVDENEYTFRQWCDETSPFALFMHIDHPSNPNNPY